MLKATVQGLQSLRRPEEVAKARGKTIADVLPIPKQQPEEEASRAGGGRAGRGAGRRRRHGGDDRWR